MNRFAPSATCSGGRETHGAYFVLRGRNDPVPVIRSLGLGPNGLLLGENKQPLDLLRPGLRAPQPATENEADRRQDEADHGDEDQAPKP